jgi:DNA repair exonuclease SbcCD ATPase subunit
MKAKLISLKLVNFIGCKNISNSLGEVFIDFTSIPDDRKIVLILGKNGAGKTTILSMLQPFAKGFDDRDGSPLIIEGKIGRKEIIYQIDDVTIEITHIYKPDTKVGTGSKISSYIKLYDTKNPLEFENLNENGGSRTFEQHIKEIFQIDTQFFSIAKIGTNVSNLISLSPSARKDLITSFLPNTEDLKRKKKIVDSKLTTFKALLKANVASFENINIDSVKTSLSQKEETSSSIKATNENLQRSYTVHQVEQDSILSNYKVLDIKGLNKINPNDERISSLQSIVDSLNENDLNNHKENLESFLMTEKNLETTQTNLSNTFTGVQSELSRLVIQRKDFETKLSESNLTTELVIKYQKAELTVKSHLNKNQAELNQLSPEWSTYQWLTQSIDFNDLKVRLNSFNQRMYEAKSSLTGVVKQILVELALKNNRTASIDTQINSLQQTIKAQIQSNTLELEQKLNVLSYKKAKESLINTLTTTTTASCNDIDCPHENTIRSYQDVSNAIRALEAEISSLRENITSLQTNLASTSDSNHFIVSFKQLFEEFKLFYNEELIQLFPLVIPKYPISSTLNEFLIEYLSDLSKSSIVSRFSIAENVYSLNNYRLKLESELEQNQSVSQDFKEQEASIKASFNSTISTLKIQEVELQKTLASIKSEISLIESSLTSVKRSIFETNALIQHYSNLESIRTELSELITFRTKLVQDKITFSGNNDVLIYLAQTLKKNSESLNDLDKEMLDLRLKELNYDKFAETIESLNAKIKIGTEISNACSSTKGIPLVISGAFLKTVKTIANIFLAEAFGRQEIEIVDFIITDKAFEIPISMSGAKPIDAELASQGETALIKIAISFAIVAFLSETTNFPFLFLDEIDSTLSKENKRRFLSIVNRQIDMLDIDKCFVISHNPIFFDEINSVILLKDHDFTNEEKLDMSVVFDYENP